LTFTSDIAHQDASTSGVDGKAPRRRAGPQEKMRQLMRLSFQTFGAGEREQPSQCGAGALHHSVLEWHLLK
jgi:hypothetical protein